MSCWKPAHNTRYASCKQLKTTRAGVGRSSYNRISNKSSPVFVPNVFWGLKSAAKLYSYQYTYRHTIYFENKFRQKKHCASPTPACVELCEDTYHAWMTVELVIATSTSKPDTSEKMNKKAWCGDDQQPWYPSIGIGRHWQGRAMPHCTRNSFLLPIEVTKLSFSPLRCPAKRIK